MKEHVVIVGGGLAGLCAAYTLAKSQQCSVELLEARERLGGRVKTLQIEGCTLDVGGFIVMPWYRYFLQLVQELGLKEKLHSIPPECQVLYQFNPREPVISFHPLHSSWQDKLQLGWITLKALLHPKKLNVPHPDLKAYQHQTVKEYVVNRLGENSPYERFLESQTQGYGFAPLEEYKMAFFAPIAYKTLLKGGVGSSFYFKEGTNVLIAALKENLLSQSVTIRTGIKITDFKKNCAYSPDKTPYTADKFIFASTVEPFLYRQLLGVKGECSYTEYFTVVMRLIRPMDLGQRPWGALFLGPDPNKPYQIMSLVNLHRSFRFECPHDVMVNLVVRNRQGKALSRRALLKILEEDLLLSSPKKNLIPPIHYVHHWKKMMPIAQENFVRSVRKRQGKEGIYFAGDFLGCPSMETAVATGMRVAEEVLKALQNKQWTL